jgi:hypothetical protein
MKLYGGLSDRDQQEEGRRNGKGERTLRVKKLEVHYMYTYEGNIMYPTKHCKKEEERDGEWK